MHILIPAIIDIQKAAPNRLHQFIKSLSQNHEITVVCIDDHWKAEQVDTSIHYQDFNSVLSKVKIIHITERRIIPILQELFAPIFLRDLKNDGFDVILNYNTLISGRFLAKKFHIPMVYDIADDLPAMIQNSPQIPGVLKTAGGWFGQRCVQKTVASATQITGISKKFQDIYEISETKFHVIPNGVNTDLFQKVPSSVKSDMGLTDKIVLGYVGVLREWVDLDPVYHALKELDNVVLIVVGKEGFYEKHLKKVRYKGIEEKVIFTGHVPYERVPAYIAAMDLCLIPFQKNNPISENAVPLKLFEYMACEKPVISTRLEGVQQIVGKKIFYADTANEYISLLKSFDKNSEDLQKQLVLNCQFVEQNYTWDQTGKSLEKILTGII